MKQKSYFTVLLEIAKEIFSLLLPLLTTRSLLLLTSLRVNSLSVRTSYVYIHLCQVALETTLKHCQINQLFEIVYDIPSIILFCEIFEKIAQE